MALFRKFFYRKPPDGLLEIAERVYVFDCCFSTDIWEEDEYGVYIGGIVGKLREHFLDASFMVFNFKEGEKQSQIASILADYDMTIMEYPRHYEGCPLLTMEMIHHFLRSSESWLSLGQQNVLLMHCERGGWPILAFMLAALLIYRKQFTGEQKTLDMVFKQASRELLHLMSPLNPLPSQLRYLQYISRRNVGSHWPPLDRALTLDCVILRVIPNLYGEGGCRPIFRIYGQDPLMVADKTSKVLFSTPKSKLVRHHNQADCELVKIDIHCHVQGDVVIECISLDCDQEREEMMFRVMFNTAFIRSNILMLNLDEIDTLWNNKDQFSKDFRVEVLFSEMDSTTSLDLIDFPGLDEKDGLPIEAFAKVNEIFNSVDWQDGNIDAARNVLQHLTAIQENLNAPSVLRTEIGSVVLESSPEEVKEEQKTIELENEIKVTIESEIIPSVKLSPDTNSSAEKMAPETTPSIKQSSYAISIRKKVEPHELSIALQRPVQPNTIVQRRPQTSLSSPVSYCNSPVPTSRYHSAPSALGITALLQDQPTFTGEEVLRPVMVSLPSSAISSPVTNAPKSVQFSRVSAPPPPPPPPPHLLHSSNEASTTTGNQPCTPPQRSSESCGSSVTQQPEAANRRVPSPPATPPPSSILSISGSSVSPIIKSSLPSPMAPPPPPLPVSSWSFPSPPVKKLSSTLPVSAPSSLQPAPCTKTSPSSISKSSLSTPPPPPLPPSFSGTSPCSTVKKSCPTPPSPPPIPGISSCSTVKKSCPPPPLPPPIPGISSCSTLKNSCPNPPPPPPLPGISSSATSSVSSPQSLTNLELKPVPPLPPPPPPPSRSVLRPATTSVPSPPPPPLPSSDSKKSSKNAANSSPVPPPPAPFAKGSPKSNPGVANAPPVPGPPCPSLLGGKGRSILRASPRSLGQAKKSNLKPYHWLKLTRAMQGSLWAEPQKPDEISKTPEFDMSELESLFSVAAPYSDQGTKGGKSDRRTSKPKPEKVQLIDLRRAYNCEIMLSKVKIPLPDLMSSALALDDSSLDVDQIDNLIKFCPSKEEMELLKGYTGDKENLGRCEQFFLELMKVPRVESKLRVFSFKLQFHSQVSDLRRNLNIVNSTAEEIRGSSKLKRIMQTILSLGNALNHGTARGSAIGFRLDSLLKLTDTRARNNKMTLMHYLCKVLAEKLPELLDFPKDLISLEAATKIQLKYLAEEMQAISKGLEKVVQELTASEGDGPVSENFCTNLKEFLSSAESDVRSLTSLYSVVGRNADALALYFGEDPARCPFEQVVSTLLNFVRMFIGAHEANCKQLEYEKKKAAKEAETEKLKMGASKGESVNLIQNPVSSEEVK